MSMYDQRQSNEVFRDRIDCQAGKAEDRIYSILKSTSAMILISSVMAYCFFKAFMP